MTPELSAEINQVPEDDQDIARTAVSCACGIAIH